MRKVANKKKPNNSLQVIGSTVIILTSFVAFCYTVLLNIYREYRFVNLWMVVGLYLILFILCSNNRRYMNHAGLLIFNIVAYVRYIVQTVVYYMNDMPNDMSVQFEVESIAIYLMLYEMATVFLCIQFFAKRFYGKSKKETPRPIDAGNLDVSSNKMVVLGIFLVLFALVIARYPILLKSFKVLLTGETANVEQAISGAFWIIYNCGLILLYLTCILRIKNAGKGEQSLFKLVASYGASVIFILGVCVGSSGSVARWPLIINGVTIIVIFFRLYDRYAKVTIYVVLPVLVAALCTLTILKFVDKDSDKSEEQFEKIIQYETLDIYCAGLNNMMIAVKTKELYNDSITIRTMIDDTFQNFPILNKYIVDTMDTSNHYFNFTKYGHLLAQDQIPPNVGEGYFYFGFWGAPILSMICIMVMMKMDGAIYRAKNIYFLYGQNLVVMWCSVFMCINFTIILANMWIKAIPLCVIASVNERFIFRRKIGEK